MTKPLAGKKAVVTGASRGLGQAICARLAKAGALVAVNYPSPEEGPQETLDLIASAGGEGFGVMARLGGEAQADEMAAKLDEEFVQRTGSDRIDILVNTLGGTEFAPILTVTEEMFDYWMSRNVRTGFFLTKALYHRINDYGRVINISSAGSRVTDPALITYTMAKAGVEAFTRVLAAELGARGITVNSVGPGYTAGPTNAELAADPDALRQVKDDTALRRFGQPEEIADAVFFLASPLGRWVTAQNVEASGGYQL